MSTTAGTLEETEIVTNASYGPASLSVTFTSAVAGTTYECSVKMKNSLDDYTSAKSAPSIVTTPSAGTTGLLCTIGSHYFLLP